MLLRTLGIAIGMLAIALLIQATDHNPAHFVGPKPARYWDDHQPTASLTAKQNGGSLMKRIFIIYLEFFSLIMSGPTFLALTPEKNSHGQDFNSSSNSNVKNFADIRQKQLLGLQNFSCDIDATNKVTKCRLELDAAHIHGKYMLSTDLDGDLSTLEQLGTIDLNACQSNPNHTGNRKVKGEGRAQCQETIQVSKALLEELTDREKGLSHKFKPDWSETLVISNSAHEQVQKNVLEAKRRWEEHKKAFNPPARADGNRTRIPIKAFLFTEDKATGKKVYKDKQEKHTSNNAIASHNRRLLADGMITVSVMNNCPYWTMPGYLTGDSRYDSPDMSPNLAPAADGQIHGVEFHVPADMRANNIFAQMGCDGNGENCSSGTCSRVNTPTGNKCVSGGQPPVSQWEFTFKGDGNQDFYDQSFVDGFNIDATVESDQPGCPAIPSCDWRAIQGLPEEVVVRNQDNNVYLVKSPCETYQTDSYCCRGAFGNSESCNNFYNSLPKIGNTGLSLHEMLKQECPQQYDFPFDDKSSTFTCPSGGNYKITTCPPKKV